MGVMEVSEVLANFSQKQGEGDDPSNHVPMNDFSH